MQASSCLVLFSLLWSAASNPTPSDSTIWSLFSPRASETVQDALLPNALLTLPTGKVVLADAHLGRLYFLGIEGEGRRRLQGIGEPVGEWTALARKDALSFLALDGVQGRIHQFDLKGNYLGVAVDVNELAEAESLGRVELFGMSVGIGGNVVVSDQMGDRVLVFSPSWSLIAVWGESGSGHGQFLRPGAVAASKSGYAVADRGNSRVVLLDEYGAVVTTVPVKGEPHGLAFHGDRLVVAAEDRVEVRGRDLEPGEVLSLPRTQACDRPYASGALALHDHRLLAGEGCSGNIYHAEIRTEEKGHKERKP